MGFGKKAAAAPVEDVITINKESFVQLFVGLYEITMAIAGKLEEDGVDVNALIGVAGPSEPDAGAGEPVELPFTWEDLSTFDEKDLEAVTDTYAEQFANVSFEEAPDLDAVKMIIAETLGIPIPEPEPAPAPAKKFGKASAAAPAAAVTPQEATRNKLKAFSAKGAAAAAPAKEAPKKSKFGKK